MHASNSSAPSAGAESLRRSRTALTSRPWLEPLALVLITALAAFLRFWQLDSIPPGFHYDEAFEALEAWRVLTQPSYHPIFFPGNFGLEPSFIYLTALAFKLFGASPPVMRSVAAAVGTLTVPALYAAVKEMSRNDQRLPAATALLAAAVLAVLRWHILFSRVGIEPILVPLFLSLQLLLLWRALRTNGAGAWLLLGLSAGLSFYVYPAARLLPLVLAAIVGLIALTRRSLLRGRLPGLLAAAALATVVFLPLGLQWARDPGLLLLRSTQVVAASPAQGSPIENLPAVLGMFSIRGDLDPRNNVPGMPALDLLLTIPFCLGIGVALWRWRRPVFSGILLAGLILLLPTILSEYAPHFRRAIGAIPSVALLSGLGLAVILGRPEAVSLRRVAGAVAVGAILLGSTLFSANAYFTRWGGSPDLYYAYDQGLWEIGQYVSGLPADDTVLLTPRPATDATLAFSWRDGRPVRHFDGRHVLPIPVAGLAAGRTVDYIVIAHEDFRATGLLNELFPDAQEIKTFEDADGRTYARVLRVQGPASPARLPQNAATGSWPGVHLVGYDLNAGGLYKPGDVIYLQLWWQVDQPITGDWTVFTHLLGPAEADGSTVFAGQDARPGDGSFPTTAWSPGDLLLDEYQLPLPDDIPPGEYQIEAGFYDPAAGGERVTMTDPAGRDHLVLGAVRVAPADAEGQ